MVEKLSATIVSILLLSMAWSIAEANPNNTSLDSEHENGLGEWTCGFREQILNMEQIPQDLKDDIDELLVEWAWGYMTGKNAETTTDQRKNLELVEDVQLKKMIVEGCSDKNDLSIYMVVDTIYNKWPTAES